MLCYSSVVGLCFFTVIGFFLLFLLRPPARVVGSTRKEVRHMAKNSVRTSAKVASKASKALTSSKTSKTTKTLAGSALVNRRPK